MKLKLGLTFLTVSSVATAQTTTTDCTSWSSNNVRCTTQQQAPINWGPAPGRSFVDSYQQGVKIRQAREQAEAQKRASEALARAAQSQADAAAVTKETVELHRAQSLEAGKLVSAGDCAGAQRYALGVGNFALAQQVKDYCAK